MTGIKVITGKAGQGFKIENITSSELDARLKEADEWDNIDYIDTEKDVVVMTDCAYSGNTILLSLSDDDTEYMKRILDESGYFTLVHAYTGGAVCDKDGAVISGYNHEKGKAIPVPQPQFIADAEGNEIENKNYVPFVADSMQVVQHLPRYISEKVEYDPTGHHSLYLNTTTYYVIDNWGNPVSVPDAILETVLNTAKVVKG